MVTAHDSLRLWGLALSTDHGLALAMRWKPGQQKAADAQHDFLDMLPLLHGTTIANICLNQLSLWGEGSSTGSTNLIWRVVSGKAWDLSASTNAWNCGRHPTSSSYPSVLAAPIYCIAMGSASTQRKAVRQIGLELGLVLRSEVIKEQSLCFLELQRWIK